ncbi:hypothetical protein [Anabaena azotica]|nr:hypothetical protein [Anabaena azotica]
MRELNTLDYEVQFYREMVLNTYHILLMGNGNRQLPMTDLSLV